MSITIFLADDHTMVREGLRLPLSNAVRQASAQEDEVVLERYASRRTVAPSWCA